ncbi:MAG: Ig-like domain-containing protein [Acetatifactor sp.]|nr:Ig-like domain-containing protein [Acetatifactor sp.]
MKKTIIATIIFVYCLLFSIPCQAVTKQLTFKTTVSYKIIKGEKFKLYVKGYKTSKKVTWKSSNKKIATVSKKGVVVGKKPGTCKIIAKVGKKKYTAKVTVFSDKENIVYNKDVSPEKKKDRYDSIDYTEINAEKKTLYTGQTFSLKITGTKNSIQWKSSNNNVAAVSSSGEVTAISTGTATITASFEIGSYIYEHTCEITVTPEWMSAKDIESYFKLTFSYFKNSIHISGASSENSISGTVKSTNINDIPDVMETDIIYGSDVRYKSDGTNILFNIADLDKLGLLG